MRNFLPILLLIGVSFAGPCYSLDELNADTEEKDIGGYIEPERWQEVAVIVPPYPQADDLLKVQVDRGEMPFDFYLDAKNLSVLPKAGLTRYTVVIESDSGARNVMYEGIRCQTREYRTYAYGISGDKFEPARVSSWKRIREQGDIAHRYSFYRYYMCNEYLYQNPVKIVLDKVKYPDDFQVSDERDD